MPRRIVLAGILTITCLLTSCGDSQEKVAAQKHRAVASDTLKSLRKIEAATQVESSLSQYNQIVIDAKAQVNEAKSVLPDSELMKEFNAAIDTYADAGVTWGVLNNRGVLQFGNDEPGESMTKKYNLKRYGTSAEAIKRLGNADVYESEKRKEILGVIWAAAKSHVDRAALLIQ